MHVRGWLATALPTACAMLPSPACWQSLSRTVTGQSSSDNSGGVGLETRRLDPSWGSGSSWWGLTGPRENPFCPQIVQMSNYCGIGIDAELSLDFHQAREEEPGKFTSRCPRIQ